MWYSVLLWSSLATLFGVALGGSSPRECPAPVFIKPCTCTRARYPVTVECRNQTEPTSFQKVFDQSDHPFTKLVVDRSYLLYLPTGALLKKGVEQIAVSNSSLLALFDHHLPENNKVSHLHVLTSTLQRGFQWSALREAKALLEVVVEGTVVRQVGKVFEKSVSPTLELLRLSNTKTKSFSPTAFSKLVSLKTIVIVKTKLKTLKRSMFPQTNHLFVMDFSFNDIETLPDDLFSNMENIYDVSFYGNKLKVFSEKVFGHIMDTSVTSIDLQENPIACDCTFRWFVHKERYVEVGGTCSSPVDKKGKKFRALRAREFEYCPHGLQNHQ